MLKPVKIGFLTIIGLLFSIILFSSLSKEPDTKNASSGQFGDRPTTDMPRAFQNALTKFEKYALFYEKDIPQNFNDSKALNSYLKRMDPTSEYLEPEEYSVLETSHKDNYVGIGMEIEKNESGKIVCFPYPDSPAFSSGVESGDILESVDGEKVSGLSIYKVASKIMGVKDTKVGISIFKKTGVRKVLEVTRKYIATSSVAVESITDFSIIKINSFSSGTKRDLKSALSGLEHSSPIILDLRDNPGGDLYKAIDSAMLFLGNDVKIVTIKSRNGTKTYHSTTPAFNSRSSVYIWQNENTASAAEVFIAALTENGRAESIGKKSYGKGITQDVVELDDGSAIVFTSGYLLTPDDTMYHRKGIEPTYKLRGDRLTTNEYVMKTEDLMKLTRP